MRRVDRLPALIGARLGTEIEAALVANGDLAFGAILATQPGWILAPQIMIDGGRCHVTFTIELGRMLAMGTDKRAGAPEC